MQKKEKKEELKEECKATTTKKKKRGRNDLRENERQTKDHINSKREGKKIKMYIL